jgi:hypothetical protein
MLIGWGVLMIRNQLVVSLYFLELISFPGVIRNNQQYLVLALKYNISLWQMQLSS